MKRKRKRIPLDQDRERSEVLKAALAAQGADVLIDIHQGPNSQGRHFFTAYWLDDYHSPTGVHGQCFRAAVSEFIEHNKERGKVVEFCPQELHEDL